MSKELPKEFQDALEGATKGMAADFEGQLGLLCHAFILAIGIDHVIEGLDIMIEALELRRDTEFNRRPPSPPPAP